jgi:hypothetical protein
MFVVGRVSVTSEEGSGTSRGQLRAGAAGAAYEVREGSGGRSLGPHPAAVSWRRVHVETRPGV